MIRLPITKSEAFSEYERHTILDSFFAARKKMVGAAAAYDEADEKQKAHLAEKLDIAHKHVSDLYEEYEKGVPVVALSRCPFTGVEAWHSIDSYGIDGPWWDYERPARPVEDLPNTYFALAGALKLSGELVNGPFLCKPGPEVPYVIPRLLARPEIKAVIFTTPVGSHMAFPIFYFAEPMPWDIVRTNTWGTNSYSAETIYGEGYWQQTYDIKRDFDFELEKWIRAGKLLWIAPEDDTMTLQSIIGRCPYIGISGRRYPVCIQAGRVWSSMID